MGIVIKSVTAILILLLGIAGLSYAASIASEKPLDDAARAAAPGEFVALSDGNIHYRWFGPEDGETIVMVHGFSTPNFIFAQNAEALALAGFRVLTFDHFGRGWSDRPETAYTPDFYDRALVELTDALQLDRPFGLVGLSMGGVISAEFAARHPERISKLFLFVPAGLSLAGEAGSMNDRISNTPVLGEFVWQVFGKRILLGNSQYEEGSLPMENRLAGDVIVQMGFKGYFLSLLSSYRNLPMRDADQVFQRVSSTGLPVMAVFGGRDTTVLPKSAERLAAAIPKAKIELLPDGDHGLNYKMHMVTSPMLIEYFSESQ